MKKWNLDKLDLKFLDNDKIDSAFNSTSNLPNYKV